MNGRRPHGGGNEPSVMPFKLKTPPRTMTTSNELPRLAVFIDAENVGNPESIELVFNKIKVEKLGTPTVKRVYGNPTLLHSKKWEAKCKEHGIEIVEQERFVPHKNSADVKIVVDAVRLRLRKNKNKINAFCFVSSDTDFRPLVEFISKGNRKVYGFGKESTLPALCKVFKDGFFPFEKLQGKQQNPNNRKQKQTILSKIATKNATACRKTKQNAPMASEKISQDAIRWIKWFLEIQKSWTPASAVRRGLRATTYIPKGFDLIRVLKSNPTIFAIRPGNKGSELDVRLAKSISKTETSDT